MSIFLFPCLVIGYNILGTKMNEYVSCYIEMYGFFEPWWFLEGWERYCSKSRKFDQYYDALKYYKTFVYRVEQIAPLYKSRSDLMTFLGPGRPTLV